ncbi:Iron (Metal) dependent repressor, DtxR family [Candidatus Nitrosocaldus cavascurensis]|uniref:Iron (Metal) dependent repressor, DtxR family n=1 Tax=Candidatus Nitrosocaldus cavascurensis TaxID=2058097 RepID=A0A2K5APU0_9ARCH|nr:Iron (Metal) dependent repressor, DtxR family [Candidatus Nitrosocaldus cavascurensis]
MYISRFSQIIVLGKARDRLESIKAAHSKHGMGGRGRTQRMEDYLEVIYELMEHKGYVSMSDISNYLNVSSASVTKMVQRLHESGYIEYEKYRGIRMKDKGLEIAKMIRERHSILIELLLLLGIEEEDAHRITEGIEHYFDNRSLKRLEQLIQIIKSDESIAKRISNL